MNSRRRVLVTVGLLLGLFLGALVGTGLGLTIAPLLIAAQNSVSRDQMGAATSLMPFTRTLGAALGVAIMGAFLAGVLHARGPKIAGAPTRDDMVDPIRRRSMTES